MNVGFYYHVEALFERDGVARVPALLGLFVQELARQAGHVTFYAHGLSRAGIEDFVLAPPFVHCVNLGPRRGFPERMFLPARSLRAFTPAKDEVDVMLVRGPSPLLPHIVRSSGRIPVALHIVGQYTGHKRDPIVRTMPWWRDALIRGLFRLYEQRQRSVACAALVLVNTPDLIERFEGHENVDVVFASTLRSEDVVSETRTGGPGLGRDRPARLLFTGRIVPEKGLWEAVEAVSMLGARGFDVHLDVVGWEAAGDPVVVGLRHHIRRCGVADRVLFVGYVPAGPPLTAVYRAADIFVLPSYGEGFPHSLFEAMGSGIPTITTPVGGIPHWIRDEREALLVPPRSSRFLAEAIERLISDDALRERVARGGWEFARQMTLEKGCDLLAKKLLRWTEVSGGARSRP